MQTVIIASRAKVVQIKHKVWRTIPLVGNMVAILHLGTVGKSTTSGFEHLLGHHNICRHTVEILCHSIV